MMRQRLSRWTCLALVVLCCIATSCGQKKSEVTDEGPSNREMLREFSELLKAHVKDFQKPPARPADLARYEPSFPFAYHGLTSKVVTYHWGAPFKSDGNAGNTVLAYEKDVTTTGGWVLMQDGELKKLTPDEFKAAPKASK